MTTNPEPETIRPDVINQASTALRDLLMPLTPEERKAVILGSASAVVIERAMVSGTPEAPSLTFDTDALFAAVGEMMFSLTAGALAAGDAIMRAHQTRSAEPEATAPAAV